MYTMRNLYLYRVIAVSLFVHTCSVLSVNRMHFVPGDVNFADYHYVGTHNSHVYKRFFTTTYQHETSIEDQLNNGVRGLMPDAYPWDESEMNPTLIKTNRTVGHFSGNVLSHAKPGIIAFSQKGFTGWDGILAIVEYQTWEYELEVIINFLRKNPAEIVVVAVEDYIGIEKLSAATEDTVKRLGYDPLFKPRDWNPKQAFPDVWPTLEWMRRNNKRLMIRTGNTGSPVYRNFGVIWDDRNFDGNAYGVVNTCSAPVPAGCNPEKVCEQTSHNPGVTLSGFSHHREEALVWALPDVERDNSYEVLKPATERCKAKGLFNGKYPNGVFTDRTVESVKDLERQGKKTIFDLINEWNDQAAQDVTLKKQRQEALVKSSNSK